MLVGLVAHRIVREDNERPRFVMIGSNSGWTSDNHLEVEIVRVPEDVAIGVVTVDTEDQIGLGQLVYQPFLISALVRIWNSICKYEKAASGTD